MSSPQVTVEQIQEAARMMDEAALPKRSWEEFEVIAGAIGMTLEQYASALESFMPLPKPIYHPEPLGSWYGPLQPSQ